MLVTGAGPIGLLAALMGVQRGLAVHMLDRNESGPKPALVRDLTIELDIGEVNRALVLDNGIVFGSVNANRSHYEAAAQSLVRVDKGWPSRLITRRVPLDDWEQVLRRRPDDVKVVIELAA